MRELILNRIEILRAEPSGFGANSKGTMRWRAWYISPSRGMIPIHTKKDRGLGIHLSETTRETFNALTDAQILYAFEIITRQMGKQM